MDRDFSAVSGDRLWVADITYVRTWTGFLYLAVVLDAWSRRVVGWSMASHLRTELVLDALNMAIWQRRPRGVVHHSDQGSQYTSIAFGTRCKEAGVRPSTGSVGDAYDTALCESSSAATPGAHGDLRVRRGLLTTGAGVTRLPVAGRVRGQPRADGSMSTPEAQTHGARSRHPTPIRVLRADRQQNRDRGIRAFVSTLLIAESLTSVSTPGLTALLNGRQWPDGRD